MTRHVDDTRKQAVRCAIYTRKSTEEGLEQEFNSLDAQRESAEAYIASQKSEGWTCLPTRYDDGGYTGGNMDRPAIKRLLADIEGGKVDCIVVYKVDRLSRSLLDFSRIIETLDRHNVSFVSVTQQFNTTTSMGRLTLNILLSFAQFEREIISERTRDKMSAARKKGKWTGGQPVLGYNVAAGGGKVVVNEAEAARVRELFELYLDHEAVMKTVREANRRGWRSKEWTTRKGKRRGGRLFTKQSLHRLLTNVAYLGKVRYKDNLYPGEHAAIIDEGVWDRVQAALRHNGQTGGCETRNKYGALLRGLLSCKPCSSAMVHALTAKGNKRYRYYVCGSAQKRGWDTCPAPSIPAAEIERFVVERIRAIGKDGDVLARTLEQARRQSKEGMEALQEERRRLEGELKRCNDDVRRLVDQADGNGGTSVAARLADLQERIRSGEQRATEIREQIIAMSGRIVDERELAAALSLFDPTWDSLSPTEQARVIHLLVEQVTYDGVAGTLAVTFRPTGIKALAEEVTANVAED